MTKTQQILDTIAAHPQGITNAAIAKATNIDASHVATVTGQKFRAGKLTREEAGATPSGVISYRYFPVASAPKKAAPLAKVSKRQDSFETLLDTLARSMADQVMARMRTHLVERLEQHQSYVPALPAPPKAPEVTKEKVRLPRVGVTGLLPQQAGVIQTEFCETFDISFWNDRQGDSSEKLRSIGIACEMATKLEYAYRCLDDEFYPNLRDEIRNLLEKLK